MRRLILPFFLLLSVGTIAQKSREPFLLYPRISLVEMRVLDTISHLYEVKTKRASILKVSKGSHILKPMICKRPLGDFNYYWVKVVEETGGRPVTHYNFYVADKTFEVMYFDSITKKKMTLQEWRKRKR